MRKRRLRERHPAAELNITAFMNLMVVLVPFLLMTAVFTHITILDINLPSPDSQSANQPDKPPFELQITIRADRLVVSDNRAGALHVVKRTGSENDYARLKEFLKQVKARIPDHTSVTVLAEPNTNYDDLIQAMDSARSFRAQVNGEWVFAELFPDISIGDAPATGN